MCLAFIAHIHSLKKQTMKSSYINRYLHRLLLFRIDDPELQNISSDFFTISNELQAHDTMQNMHYHFPSVKTNWKKCCLRYHAAQICNKIIALRIPTKPNEFTISKTLNPVVSLYHYDETPATWLTMFG